MDEVRYRYRLAMTPFPFQWGGFFTVGVLGVTPSTGLMVSFLGWWKQWGIAPPAHLI